MQYYTDPVTGYIFRSKLDALRFLDHGDVNLCAMRPKVKDKDGNEVVSSPLVCSWLSFVLRGLNSNLHGLDVYVF